MPVPVGGGIVRLSDVQINSDLNMGAYKLYTRFIQATLGTELNLMNQLGQVGAYISSASPPYLTLNAGLRSNLIFDVSGGIVSCNASLAPTALRGYSGANILLHNNLLGQGGVVIAAPTLRGDAILDNAGTGTPSFDFGLNTDTIAEYTPAHGIDLLDPVTLAALTSYLTQRYRTAKASDTQRWASDAEVSIANPGNVETVIKTGPTIPDWYSGSSNEFRITFDGKATNVSPDDEMYLTVNGVEVGARVSLSNVGYTTWSQDIGGLSAGDVIRVVCINPAGTGGDLYCRNFRVKSTDTVAVPMTTETW